MVVVSEERRYVAVPVRQVLATSKKMLVVLPDANNRWCSFHVTGDGCCILSNLRKPLIDSEATLRFVKPVTIEDREVDVIFNFPQHGCERR